MNQEPKDKHGSSFTQQTAHIGGGGGSIANPTAPSVGNKSNSSRKRDGSLGQDDLTNNAEYQKIKVVRLEQENHQLKLKELDQEKKIRNLEDVNSKLKVTLNQMKDRTQ